MVGTNENAEDFNPGQDPCQTITSPNHSAANALTSGDIFGQTLNNQICTMVKWVEQ